MIITFLLENTLVEFLQSPTKIVGIIVAALGFALSILAKKIARVAHKVDKVPDNDPIYVIFLGLALCLMLVGMVITIFN